MAGLALLPTRSLAALAGPASLPLPSYAAMAAQVNTTFRVWTESGQGLNLTLLQARPGPQSPVRPGRPAPGDAGYEKFSLIFAGPRHQALAPAIHTFEHDQLGRMVFHLSEVGPRNADRLRYEAVFNYPRSAARNRLPAMT
jgi:hypothetical protein